MTKHVNEETRIMQEIRKALGLERDFTLWRNNVGKATAYDDKTPDKPRYIKFGLCPGSADLVGILAPSGRFVALEVKTPTGAFEDGQEEWLALVVRRGGFACVIRSVDDARAALARARAGASS
jgi:hypothetical protein